MKSELPQIIKDDEVYGKNNTSKGNKMLNELKLSILKRAVLIEKDLLKKRRKAFNKKYPRTGDKLKTLGN